MKWCGSKAQTTTVKLQIKSKKRWMSPLFRTWHQFRSIDEPMFTDLYIEWQQPILLAPPNTIFDPLPLLATYGQPPYNVYLNLLYKKHLIPYYYYIQQGEKGLLNGTNQTLPSSHHSSINQLVSKPSSIGKNTLQ